jgi:hypothetical protein
MRPIFKFAFVPMLCLVGVPVSAAPIEFVSGTGQETVTAPAFPLTQASSDDGDAAQDMERMAQAMTNPKMQDGVAHMVENMTNMMLHLPVGQFAQVIEKSQPHLMKKHIRSDATLADLAGRDSKDMPEKLGKESRNMMAMMGGFTKAFATMLPEFEKIGKEMGAEMEAGLKQASND